MSLDRSNGLQSLSLHNLAFTVSDLDKTIQWYGDILEFKVLNRVTFPAIGAQVAFLQHADVRLEVLQAPGGFRLDEMFADAPAHLLPIGNKVLVLQVNDLSMATQELEEKGVRFAWKEVDLTGEGTFSTMIRDADGNFINIFQRAPAEPLA
jgi:catechol 2,3-dioxygenase-like lactoylglutathione lyase family enzyme